MLLQHPDLLLLHDLLNRDPHLQRDPYRSWWWYLTSHYLRLHTTCAPKRIKLHDPTTPYSEPGRAALLSLTATIAGSPFYHNILDRIDSSRPEGQPPRIITPITNIGLFQQPISPNTTLTDYHTNTIHYATLCNTMVYYYVRSLRYKSVGTASLPIAKQALHPFIANDSTTTSTSNRRAGTTSNF